MDSLIDKHNNYSGLGQPELEIKVQFGDEKDTFISILESVSTKHTQFKFEESLELITNKDNNSKKVIKLYYENGVQNKDKKEIYLKTSLSRPIFNEQFLPIKFKTTLNEEKELKSGNIEFSIVRFKSRVMFIIEDWRYDFTVIRHEDKLNSIPEVNEVKKEFIRNHKTMKEYLNFPEATSYEIELEYIGKNIKRNEITATIETFMNFIDLKKFVKVMTKEDYILKIAQLIRAPRFKTTLKELSNGVKELNKQTYDSKVRHNLKDYIVFNKLDGIRAFAYIINSQIVIVTDKDILLTKTIEEEITGEYIIDGEFYEDKFYAFDMLYNNKNITNEDYIDRFKDLMQNEKLVKEIGEIKNYVMVDTAEDIQKFYEEQTVKFIIDGLIFNPKRGSYDRMSVFKWKPVGTIDFLAKKLPDTLYDGLKLLKKPKMDLYVLYNTSNENREPLAITKLLFKGIKFNPRRIPYHFSPPDAPEKYIYYHTKDQDLDNRVIELSHSTNEWKFVMIREDKDALVATNEHFGNFITVANLTWNSINNPVTFKYMLEKVEINQYFAKSDTNYKNVRNYNSAVKDMLHDKFVNKHDIILDLACGKGQDVNRYEKSKFNKVVFVDNDTEGLEELKTNRLTGMSYTPYVQRLDLNKQWNLNYDKLLNLTKMKDYEIIVCNLAIHYLIDDELRLDNFMKFINKLSRKGTRFIFTCWNGERVFNKIGDKGWKGYSDELLKYDIRPEYTHDKFTSFGMGISAKLPFADDLKYEYLVDINSLLKRFKKEGWEVLGNNSYISNLEKYKKERKTDYYGLVEKDFEFIELYEWCCVEK